MKKNFDFLLDRMKGSRPVLLLGAGFSVGAKSQNGNPIPMGKTLSEDLYNHFFIEHPIPGVDKELLDEISEKKHDLKEVCTYLRLLGKSKERDLFLTEVFQNCQSSPDDFHNKLVNYEWQYIFTLNIDDLVESIYASKRMELSVWDRNNLNGSDRTAPTNLIKLHGSVGAATEGYVFDSEEYRNFTIDEDSLLREFAHQALQHDLVLIGTQFQEEDLKTILELYERSGYSNSPFYRFFVLPSLSGKLELQLKNSPNNVWIQGDTQTFLDKLNDVIVVPNREKSRLNEIGTVFLDDISRQSPPSYELYKGRPSTYPDFFHNADIISEDLPLWKKEIDDSKSNVLMSFFGNEYIGKSCFIKRLLVNLSGEGYVSLQLNRLDENVFDLLLQYLKSLPPKTKVAIYADNAAYHYNDFINLKQNCPPNILKLVLLLEDTLLNHLEKEYILLEDTNCLLHHITTRMDDYYATQIYEKLSRNRRLNKYLDLIPKKEKTFSKRARDVITSKIRQENDIIDALYYSTEGEPFQRHYERWLQKNALNVEKSVLYSLCHLHQLGITKIPNPLVTQIGKKQVNGFRLDSFIKKYSDVIKESFGCVKLYRGRILSTIIGAGDSKQVIQTLQQVAIYATPVDEWQHNGLTAIFERAIKVRRIRKLHLLQNKDILLLLGSLEEYCNHISYFWVQFGIAAQINGEFEDASNHLRYALSMRPNSYQVNHALANNEMLWGIHLLNSKIGDGDSKFLQGAERMYQIAQDKGFSKSYRYSVHSYINMWLEYAKVPGRVIDESTAETCVALLDELLNHPLDNRLTSLTRSFIDYCERNKMGALVKSLKRVSKLKEYFRVENESYDID